jgi:dephospho-CoA kinase
MTRSKRPAKRPLIIGLTGSIGMGKSAVAKMFEDEGVPVFDADATVHRMQGPGGALLSQIESAFPGAIGPQGVDRAVLGSIVLHDKDQLAKLESIIHPAVAAERAVFLDTHAKEDIVVFDIPLLFEKGGAKNVDVIVVVSAPAGVQRTRVLARPGMTESKFENILKLQMPDKEKRELADHVIDTGASLAQTGANIQKLVRLLRSPLAHGQK